MGGELLDIIYQFFLGLFSNDYSYIEDLGMNSFSMWLQSLFSTLQSSGSNFITEDYTNDIIHSGDYTISTTYSNYSFFDKFILNAGGGDPYQVGEIFISGILTIVVAIILIILLFKLFKWIFSLVFKLFRAR